MGIPSDQPGGRHILVEGKVQGVGFRRFVETRALELSVNGYVRNLNDGRVEILTSQNNADFEAAILVGPQFSSVTKIDAHDVSQLPAGLGAPTTFKVLTDGESAWFQY